MQGTKFEALLEEGAVDALEKVINPFIRGKLDGSKFDPKKLNASLQMVSNYQRVVGSREHRRGLNLIAIKMMTGDDKEAAKTMIQKHFDSALMLPAPAK